MKADAKAHETVCAELKQCSEGHTIYDEPRDQYITYKNGAVDIIPASFNKEQQVAKPQKQ